ncbi:MAG: type II toxin-antitoxin system VapC family toxin [Myxococcota bacterium]
MAGFEAGGHPRQTRPILRAAARLRAVTGVKTPDAMQLATAMANGWSTFLTNDLGLPDLPSLRVVQLDAYLPDD